MIISPVVEVYRNNITAGHEYVIAHETCEQFASSPYLKRIIKKYPGIRNIYYGWGNHADTQKPTFRVEQPLGVLFNIWNQISKLPKGDYFVATEDVRVLNIYRRRWLNSKNSWKLLEAGMLPENGAYIVIRR